MRRMILLFTVMAAALLIGSGVALASSVSDVEPNDSIAGAQNIDGSFSLDFDPNIGSAYTNTSESLPHATVNGTGNETKDYYSFTVSQAGDGVILDVDEGIFCAPEGCPGFDSVIELYDSSGQPLAHNDDESTEWGQGGSISGVDSFLEYTFETPGTYYVAVGTCCLSPVWNGVIYQLHVSIGVLPEHPFLCQNQLPTIEASGRTTNGTKGDDVIAGTEGRDTINGGGGNDIICGKDGTNTINGGAGDDSLTVGSSNDTISGGAGNDNLNGGDGNDRMMGDQGSDALSGEGGDDTLDGGPSDDYISGGDGTDKCSLGEFGRDECELAIGPKVNR
jgi:Ca2+-binding RTX toxin-like protein